MNNFILILLLWSLVEGLYKGVSVYHEFMKGVKEGLELLIVIFPTLMLLTLWVNLFQSCGVIVILENMFFCIHEIFNVPIDILLMCFIRPISSQGALVVLKSIYDKFGVDHIYSILGSIIQTGSDTTLYVVSLYFQSIKARKSNFPLFLGLFLDFIACLLAFVFYYLFII